MDDGKHPRGAGDGPPLDQLDRLLEDPQAWPGLDPDLLRHLLFYGCLSFGVNPDDDDVPRVMRLAKIAIGRLPPAVRREVALQVARAVERLHREHGVCEGAGYTNGLLPFLVEDPDPSVVAAAACDMAILLPLENDDPMSGPQYVRSLLDEIDADEARAGVVAGLLSLGDARVEPLVGGTWRLLGEEGRQSLALLIQAVHGLHVLTVRFLLDWLEGEAADPATPSFGMVAATVARAGAHAADHGIVEVARAFPVTSAPEGQPFRVLREWSLEEFLPTVRPRMRRLLSVANPPELLGSALRYWSVGPGTGR